MKWLSRRLWCLCGLDTVQSMIAQPQISQLDGDEADKVGHGVDCLPAPEMEDQKYCAVLGRVLDRSELTKKPMAIRQQWH